MESSETVFPNEEQANEVQALSAIYAVSGALFSACEVGFLCALQGNKIFRIYLVHDNW
jgi:hypothetical protein